LLLLALLYLQTMDSHLISDALALSVTVSSYESLF